MVAGHSSSVISFVCDWLLFSRQHLTSSWDVLGDGGFLIILVLSPEKSLSCRAPKRMHSLHILFCVCLFKSHIDIFPGFQKAGFVQSVLHLLFSWGAVDMLDTRNLDWLYRSGYLVQEPVYIELYHERYVIEASCHTMTVLNLMA